MIASAAVTPVAAPVALFMTVDSVPETGIRVCGAPRA